MLSVHEAASETGSLENRVPKLPVIFTGSPCGALLANHTDARKPSLTAVRNAATSDSLAPSSVPSTRIVERWCGSRGCAGAAAPQCPQYSPSIQLVYGAAAAPAESALQVEMPCAVIARR